jgi:hypothetical protein
MYIQALPKADMDDFFKHKNIWETPALSSQEKLMSGTKSSLLSCLPGMPDHGLSPEAKETSLVVCDISAVIHLVKPHHSNVFGEYTLHSTTHRSTCYLLPFLRS